MTVKPLLANGIVQRSQDISPIKQNQDLKPQVEQQNIQMVHQKQVDRTAKQIIRKEATADFKENRHDAREKTRGIYFDTRKKKKSGESEEQEDGKVIPKTTVQHFDMRI